MIEDEEEFDWHRNILEIIASSLWIMLLIIISVKLIMWNNFEVLKSFKDTNWKVFMTTGLIYITVKMGVDKYKSHKKKELDKKINSKDDNTK